MASRSFEDDPGYSRINWKAATKRKLRDAGNKLYQKNRDALLFLECDQREQDVKKRLSLRSDYMELRSEILALFKEPIGDTLRFARTLSRCLGRELDDIRDDVEATESIVLEFWVGEPPKEVFNIAEMSCAIAGMLSLNQTPRLGGTWCCEEVESDFFNFDFVRDLKRDAMLKWHRAIFWYPRKVDYQDREVPVVRVTVQDIAKFTESQESAVDRWTRLEGFPERLGATGVKNYSLCAVIAWCRENNKKLHEPDFAGVPERFRDFLAE